MDKLKDYNIAFKGLKDGKHQFHYSIDADFFQKIEGSVINNGRFEADIILTKRSQMLQLDFKIDGDVHTTCDNCLGDLTLPISHESTIYIKFGIEYDEPSDEIIVLPYEENEYNVAHLIYEFIVISKPIRSVHEDLESCDQDMIQRLQSYNHAEHSSSNDNNKAIDPRWEALKKLKDNSN